MYSPKVAYRVRGGAYTAASSSSFGSLSISRLFDHAGSLHSNSMLVENLQIGVYATFGHRRLGAILIKNQYIVSGCGINEKNHSTIEIEAGFMLGTHMASLTRNMG